jgi:DNA polymerase III delta subunit
MSQIFLLTGENRHMVREERMRWVSHFREKHGDENLSILEAKQVRFNDLLDEIASAPFIAEKRLVLVDTVPKLEKEEVSQLTEHIHPDVVLVFVDPKPDRRLSSVKQLLKLAEIKEFKPLRGMALHSWMAEVVKPYDAQLTRVATDLILSMVGEDQEMLLHELTKLATFASGREIVAEDVKALTLETSEQVWWRLTELIGSQNFMEAVTYCESLLHRGESPHALWNRLLWMMSSLVQIAAAYEDGKTSSAQIAKATDVKPGTIRTLLPLARSIDSQRLRASVSQFVTADKDLKTGGYRSTVDDTGELLALIDRGILSLAQ